MPLIRLIPVKVENGAPRGDVYPPASGYPNSNVELGIFNESRNAEDNETLAGQPVSQNLMEFEHSSSNQSAPCRVCRDRVKRF